MDDSTATTAVSEPTAHAVIETLASVIVYVAPAVRVAYAYVPAWPESKGHTPSTLTSTCILYSLRSSASYGSFCPLAYEMMSVPPPDGYGQLEHGAITAACGSCVVGARPRSRIVYTAAPPVCCTSSAFEIQPISARSAVLYDLHSCALPIRLE